MVPVTVRNVLYSAALRPLTTDARCGNYEVKHRRVSENRKSSTKSTTTLSWNKIAEEATVDCYGEYEQMSGWQIYLRRQD